MSMRKGQKTRRVEVVCVECGGRFEAGRIDAKYCPACKKERRTMRSARERGERWAQLDHVRELRSKPCADCGGPCWRNSERCQSCASRKTVTEIHRKRRAEYAEQPPETERTCIGCGETKAIDDFHRFAGNFVGRHARCKVCRAEYGLEYREKYREAIADRNHRGRQIRRGIGTDSLADVMAVLRQQPCAYCGADGPIHIDHIFPIARGGLHEVTNIAPACADCNLTKSARVLFDGWDPPRGFYFDLTTLGSGRDVLRAALDREADWKAAA